MKMLPGNKGALFMFRFVSWFLVIYGFNIFFIGVAAEGGIFHSRFLEDHFNYISWWRSSLLNFSNLLTNACGLNSKIHYPYTLSGVSGASVKMVYSCIGYGITSFWIAFVVANDGSAKKKIVWSMAGIILIFFVNCCRITLLLFALQNKWKVNHWMDHHTIFNIVAYLLIFTMIFLYSATSKMFRKGFNDPQLISNL